MRTTRFVCRFRVKLLVALACCQLTIVRTHSAQSTPITRPRFESYPVTEDWQGPRASLKLPQDASHTNKAALLEGVNAPPNFAGHYRFVVWSCGTRCEAGAVIDLKTGEVFSPPLGSKKNGWEHWILCVSVYAKGGVEYRPDSSLMIVRCGGMADEQAVNTPDEYYFVWGNNHFRRLLYIKGTGKHSLAWNQQSQMEASGF